MYGFSTQFLCATNYVAADLINVHGVCPSKIKILRFLLPDPPSTITPRKKNTICFVGRFYASKGQECLIRALPLILQKVPGAEVIFIGEGPLLNRCKKLTYELKVGSSCKFIGRLPSMKEIYDIMAASTLKIVASHSEGFGLVVVEALSVGTPVLLSDIPVFRENIVEGKNGLFFKLDDHEDLAKKAVMVLTDSDLAAKLSVNSKKHFYDTFSLEQHARKYAVVLASLFR